MLQLLSALLVGTVIGAVAGLLPGLHPNNTIPVILGLSLFFDPLSIGIVLLVSGIVNCFVNFIPSILLGAPEDSTALGVLPGHKLLLQGRGLEAIKLCVIGSLGGVIFSILSLPLFALLIPPLYKLVRPYVHWLLIVVIGYLILTERKKVFALAVFTLSGILGVIVLDNFSDSALFPLLTGLFGLPMLLISVFQKTRFPERFDLEEEGLSKSKLISSIGIGSLAGILAGLLPGIGATQSTILTQQIFNRKDDDRSFLVSIGAITTSDIVYSILALFLIGNPRSGIAVGISKVLRVSVHEIIIFITTIIISSGLATYLTLKLTGISLKFLRRINYQRMCLLVILFLFVLTFLFSGLEGLFILWISTSIGLIPNLLGIRRSHAMGCLLVPTIIFFFKFYG
jgi:putative membrane protein